MSRASLLLALAVLVAGCGTFPSTTTASDAETVDRLAAQEQAVTTVEAWHDDPRPFVYGYNAECPEDQPAQAGHRFKCSVEITAHVAGYPDRIGFGYPHTVQVLIEVINPIGQMLGEVVEE